MIKFIRQLNHSILLAAFVFGPSVGRIWAVENSSASQIDISIGISGVSEGVIEQGEPLRIKVQLAASTESKKPIEISNDSGSWVDLISVQLVRAGGGPGSALRAEVVGKTAESRAVLDQTRVAGALWRISDEVTRGVVPGSYVVRASLHTGGGSGSGTEVVSDDVPLTVLPPSDVSRVVARAVNRAQDALLRDQIEMAAAEIDRVLTQKPDEPELLLLRAMICERAGNPAAALICAYRLEKNRGKAFGEPATEVEELLARLNLAIRSLEKPNESLPAWSWPPSVVFPTTDGPESPLSPDLQKQLGVAGPMRK
ncbi:MAG: hypothetical protein QM790_08985 [Nibricoccus sp.]